jgi:predicted nucleic acid-binding protein
MKLVLDANVALKTVLPEADSGRASRLIADYIALARRASCRVVTADLRLLNTFPGDTISLLAI